MGKSHSVVLLTASSLEPFYGFSENKNGNNIANGPHDVHVSLKNVIKQTEMRIQCQSATQWSYKGYCCSLKSCSIFYLYLVPVSL